MNKIWKSGIEWKSGIDSVTEKEAAKGPFNTVLCLGCQGNGQKRWTIRDSTGGWVYGTLCYEHKSTAERDVERLNLAYAAYIMVQP